MAGRNNLLIKVECYAGYRGEELPRRFYIGQKPVEVTEIIDRWLAPNHHYFKIKGDDKATYIIRYDTKLDHWELTMFDSGKTCQAGILTT